MQGLYPQDALDQVTCSDWPLSPEALAQAGASFICSLLGMTGGGFNPCPTPNKLLFSFLTMALQATGPVAYIMAGAVAVLIGAVAWRLVRS